MGGGVEMGEGRDVGGDFTQEVRARSSMMQIFVGSKIQYKSIVNIFGDWVD